MSVDKASKGFNFTIDSIQWLAVADIWPDGDAPENPTVDDVLAVIAASGGMRQVLHDWNLDDDIELTVDDGQVSKVAP